MKKKEKKEESSARKKAVRQEEMKLENRRDEKAHIEGEMHRFIIPRRC